MEQVEINGLLWDAENLNIAGETFFTYDKALKAASSVGKREATDEEYERLLASGWQWSETDKGVWFAKGKLFFPATGYQNYVDNMHHYLNTHGFVWAGTPYGSKCGYSMLFCSESVNIFLNARSCGFSVRCVQDIRR